MAYEAYWSIATGLNIIWLFCIFKGHRASYYVVRLCQEVSANILIVVVYVILPLRQPQNPCVSCPVDMCATWLFGQKGPYAIKQLEAAA